MSAAEKFNLTHSVYRDPALKTKITILTALGVLLMLSNLAIQGQMAAFLGAGSERDVLFVAMSVPLFLNTLMTASFGAVTTPAVLAYPGAAHQRLTALRMLFWLVLASLLLAAAIVMARAGVVGLLAPGFAPEQAEQAGRLLALAALNIPLHAVASILSGYWIARERVFRPVASLLLGNAVATGLIAAAAEGLTSRYVVLALLAGNALATSIQLAMLVGERTKGPAHGPAPRLSAKQIYRGSLPLAAASAVGRAGPLIERNIASHLGTGTISLLGYASQLMLFLVNTTTSPAATVFYAQMCRDSGDGRKAYITEFLRRGGTLVIGGSMLISGLVVLGGEEALRVVQPYTKLTVADVGELAHYWRLLLPAYVCLALGSFVARALYAASEFLLAALLDCMAVAVYAVTAPFLGRHYQGTGLILAASANALLLLGLIVFVVARRLGLRLGSDFWIRLLLMVLGWGGGIATARMLQGWLFVYVSDFVAVLLGMAAYLILFAPGMLWLLAKQGIDWRVLVHRPQSMDAAAPPSRLI